MGFPGYQPEPPLSFQQNQPQPLPQQESLEKRPPLEELFMQFMSKMEASDGKVDQAIQAQQITIQNLERQVKQLAKAISYREKGKLPRTS